MSIVGKIHTKKAITIQIQVRNSKAKETFTNITLGILKKTLKIQMNGKSTEKIFGKTKKIGSKTQIKKLILKKMTKNLTIEKETLAPTTTMKDPLAKSSKNIKSNTKNQ